MFEVQDLFRIVSGEPVVYSEDDLAVMVWAVTMQSWFEV